MNQEQAQSNRMIAIGVAGAALIIALVALVPFIQPAWFRYHRQVNDQLEHARRLLHEYNPNLQLSSGHHEVLGEEAIKLSGQDVDAVLNAASLDVTARVNEDLQWYSQLPGMSELERDLATPPTKRLTGSGLLQTAISNHDQDVTENSKLLDQALSVLNQAKAIRVGEFAGDDHVGVNRLDGIVHYQKGLATSDKILLMRQMLADRRMRIKDLLLDLQKIERDSKLIEDSGVANEISNVQTEQQSVRNQIAESEDHVSKLEGTVLDLEQQIASARAQSEAARETMERLQDMGVDLSNPTGYEEFRDAYQRQAELYREAITRAHILQHGGLGNAAIDYTGDYVVGQYEPVDKSQPIVHVLGLTHIRQQLESARVRLEKLIETLQRLEETEADLNNLKQNLTERTTLAKESIAALSESVRQKFSEFSQAESELVEEESQAILEFNQASASFQKAVGAVQQDQRRASQDAPTDPQRAPYHYSHLAAKQDALEGQLLAQKADSALRVGFVLAGRYLDARSNANMLAGIENWIDGKSPLPRWREGARSTQAEATTIINEAIEILQDRAKQKIGEGNWTVAAQIGGAYSLLGALGTDLAAAKALKWYEAALEGREDNLFVLEHTWMKDYLQKRVSASQ